jgi:hypothetical protein
MCFDCLIHLFFFFFVISFTPLKFRGPNWCDHRFFLNVWHRFLDPNIIALLMLPTHSEGIRSSHSESPTLLFWISSLWFFVSRLTALYMWEEMLSARQLLWLEMWNGPFLCSLACLPFIIKRMFGLLGHYMALRSNTILGMGKIAMQNRRCIWATSEV